MDSVCIIIPVKDEEVGLRYLLDNFNTSLLQRKYKIRFIFAIDSRTSDSSVKIASQFSDLIVHQKYTTGKGAAIRQALEIWKKSKTTFVVFLDADGSYCFDSVEKILATLEKGTDVVSGTRFDTQESKPTGMSRLHFFGNKSLSLASSLKNRRKITDLCTGLWGFTDDAISKINITSNGFDLEAELAGLARRNRLNHTEVYVRWRQRKGGISKLRSFRDGFIILLRILRT